MTVQGKDATLWFQKDGEFVPYMCASDITITIETEEVAIRTLGDGHYKKYASQSLSWKVDLNGLLQFDADNFTAFDIVDAQRNFVNVIVRVTFDDLTGNEKTIQGNAVVKTSALSASAGELVKADFNLLGSGAFLWFDGTVSCDTSASFDGTTEAGDGSGDTTIYYVYSGAVNQVKYRLNGTGDYIFSSAGVNIFYAGLAAGLYSIEVIPLCQNGNEGVGFTQLFVVTRGGSCNLAITSIELSDDQTQLLITVNNPDDETSGTYQYSIDGGTFFSKNLLPDPDPIDVSGLAFGDHTVDVVPFCSSGVLGSDLSGDFTIDSQPSQSVVNWTFNNDPFSGNQFWIYVDGVMVINETAADLGNSINVNVGQVVRVVLQCTATGGARGVSLQTVNSTTSTTLNSQSGRSPQTFIFSWTADGSTYQVGANITP